MKPVDQTVMHNPPEMLGNCFRACVASVLEVDIDSMPPFEEKIFHGEAGEWFQQFTNWLHDNGHELWYWMEGQSKLPIRDRGELYIIASGPSPRFGDVGHCIVLQGEEMVHDPHPSRDGLDGRPFDYMVIRKDELDETR